MTERIGRRRILFLICALLALIFGLRYSELCAEGVRYGIELSVNKLIPSLFPFMVISELIISTDACSLITKIVSKPFSKIFKMTSEGAMPFLLGMLFGFPIGIRSAITLYENGKIDKRDLTRLSLFTSIPSPAFFISAVGEGLFGSALFGVALYLIALLGSLLIGIFSYPFFENMRGEYFSLQRKTQEVNGNGFIFAVTSSTQTLISVCSFVVFFSMLSEVAKYFLTFLPISEKISLCLIGALEMTGGAALASSLGKDGAPLAAAILGFSGISVLCQFIAICKHHRLPIMPYILSKLFLAALELLLSILVLHCFAEIITIKEPCAPSFLLYRESRLSIALFSLFACSCFIALNEEKRKIFGKALYKR